MAELHSAYMPTFNDAIVQSITAKRVTKTVTHLSGTNESTSEDTLVIDIPKAFTVFEYLIATDGQGVIAKGKNNGTQNLSELSIKLQPNDKIAFVNITCTHPEFREFTRWFELTTKPVQKKYDAIADLFQSLETLIINNTNNKKPSVFETFPQTVYREPVKINL